ALGQVRRRLAVPAEALELGVDQDLAREALAVAVEGALDAPDVAEVGADARDHRAACDMSIFISRTASRMPMKTARATMAWPMWSSRTPGRRATGSTLK